MSAIPSGQIRRLAHQAAAEPPVSAAAPENAGWRLIAAATALSIAGVASPIAVTTLAVMGGSLGSPIAVCALVTLLVLGPAGVGLAAALSGFRRLAATVAATGDREVEQAVLRVIIDTLLFGYALVLVAASPGLDAALLLPVAALGLVAAWMLLLNVMLWPVASPVRLYGAIALDAALISAFLHCGGRDVAGWYPLYLLATTYAGFRFGLAALLGSGGASVLGFAGVVLSTEFWRQQPVLAAGLGIALLAVPALIAGAIRAMTAARAEAAEATADRRRIVMLIADTLRGPLATVLTAMAPDEPSGRTPMADEPAARSAGALASQINDLVAFAALETGTFAPPVEAFDLRGLITRNLAPVRAHAAEKDVVLRWRVDPRLPSRLRGRAQALARVLGSLAGHAVEVAPTGTVRVVVDSSGGDGRYVRLRLRICGSGDAWEVELADEEGPLAVRLGRRLLGLLDGEFAIDRYPGRPTRLTATLDLAIEESSTEPQIDLGNRTVLIATEDQQLAADIAGWLAIWNADPRWIGDGDAALRELAGFAEGGGAIVVVDGRRKLLSALSLAHHAARIAGAAPMVLLVTEPTQIDSLDEVDEGELDGFIPSPVTARLMGHALDALPLMAERPTRPRLDGGFLAASEARPAVTSTPAAAAERVTPIAAHPRYVPDAPAALDARVLDRLRALGGGGGFLGEVIATFRADADQLLRQINDAIALGDAPAFARAVVSLRRSAGHLGATQLCELLTTLQGVTAGELRQRGALHAQRLEAEVERLAHALMEFLPAAGATRS